MSLRDATGGNAVVHVILRRHVEGKHGRLVAEEYKRVTMTVRMQQSTTDDITAYAAAGERGVLNLKRLYCQRFPGDDLSQVIDTDGVVYEVVGEPKRHRGSAGTTRDVVTLRQTAVLREENRRG